MFLKDDPPSKALKTQSRKDAKPPTHPPPQRSIFDSRFTQMIFFVLFASSRFQSGRRKQIVSNSGIAQHVKEFLEVGGEGGFEFDPFLAYGMFEGDAPSVQSLAGEAATRCLNARIR